MANNLKLLYFSDPICSACYIFSETLDKFIDKHENDFDLEIVMGGLVKDKDSFNDPANGITSASDVAKHWQEIGDYYNKPINVEMWLNDPMESSFEPSFAIKAAQLQNKGKEMLDVLRELVFVQGVNIERSETLIECATELELDVDKFTLDLTNQGISDFNEDLIIASSLQVRVFPTLMFIKNNNAIVLTGIRDMNELDKFYEEAKETL